MTKKPTCILTDESVQYSSLNFPGVDFVQQASICYSTNNKLFKNKTPYIKKSEYISENIGVLNKPIALNLKSNTNQIIGLHEDYHDVILIIHSQFLSNAFEIATQLTQKIPDKNRVHIFDSNSFSYGLGLIVKNAAALINKGSPIDKVTQRIRNTIPHVYGIFFSQNHSTLAYPGFLTLEQVIALDILGQFPVFTIEEGRFTPFGKVSNIRNGINLFEEFIDEFDDIEELIFVSGIQNKCREVSQLQSHCLDTFPHLKFTSQFINRNTAAMIGTNAMGVFVLEKANI